MSKTRRVSYRLREGEAMLVGPVEVFEHLIELYESLSVMDAYSKEQQAGWLEAAEWVRKNVAKTANYDLTDYDE